MTVKELIEILKEYEDYIVICEGYSSYDVATEEDIRQCLDHNKKWFDPALCNSLM